MTSEKDFKKFDFKSKCGIYIFEINKKAYIGSSVDVRHRLREHFRKMKQNKHDNIIVQRCYDKYKCELFFDILEFCDKEIRLEKEYYWICKLKPELNIKPDPRTQFNAITTSKKVYQYSLKGEYMAEFESCSEAGRSLGKDGASISAVARPDAEKNKSAYGFLWSYKKVEFLNYTNNSSKAKIKKVSKYTLKGKLVETYESIADCARSLGQLDNFDGACATISGICRQKSYEFKGFTYAYGEKKRIPIRKRERAKIKERKVYSKIYRKLNGEIKTWNNVKEAATELKISDASIRNYLSGKSKPRDKAEWGELRE
jgi:group I intron endonuclease